MHVFVLFFPPLTAYTNAAGDEENKRTGVQESEVEAGLSDHKYMSPLETFPPEHVGKLYQSACKYIKSQNPGNNYIILCKNKTFNTQHSLFTKLWMLKIIQPAKKSLSMFFYPPL